MSGPEGTVRLVDWTPEGDMRLAASLLHTASAKSFPDCLETIRALGPGEREAFIRRAFGRMEFYDFVLREFEYLHLTYEIELSAAAFAQLKRHRMATITVQPYEPALGVTIPPAVREVGAEEAFREIIGRSEDLFRRLKEEVPEAAEYALTNAHRRRVLLGVNARELYHISRLREDPTAQWDIRAAAGRMSRLASDRMPLAFLLIGGKSVFPGTYEKAFGRRPKMEPPPS